MIMTIFTRRPVGQVAQLDVADNLLSTGAPVGTTDPKPRNQVATPPFSSSAGRIGGDCTTSPGGFCPVVQRCSIAAFSWHWCVVVHYRCLKTYSLMYIFQVDCL
ncbi:hypothetical protein C8R41DRAFT_808055 [Lentinula lateritia]|uniref:Uncharacterized protein n=1 Tax=Lentinula lateritia TaxID=40482 RepID=A0ABQ8VXI7_9AGAR|nr:hypothetical protein C8R41DRAFT_808055 [Lentinula lateritia]